jgi:hypothetical protein
VAPDVQRIVGHSAPTSPLSETAARISVLADYLDSRVGIPDEPGWFRVTALADAELLGAWHLEVTARIGDRRVAAAYMSNWLISFLVGGALMPVLAERRLPLANHADIAIRRNSDGWFDAVATDDDALAVLPGDPASAHPSVTVLASAEAMFDLLADQILNLEPTIAALRAACPIGLPALWGAVADGIGGTALQLAGLMGRDKETTWKDAERVIALVAARQARMKATPRRFPVQRGRNIEFYQVRGTCCLYYRTVEHPDRNGDGYCTSCPLRPDEARRRILVDWLDQQQVAAS